MSRITNAILQANQGLANFTTSPMADITYGGQHGWTPNPAEWVSNQSYVSRPLFCLLLEAPRFFQLLPNPNTWVQSLKALVELHAKSIDGLNAGLTVETDERLVGGAGEMQDEVTNVTRLRTEPKFSFTEKAGAPFQTLFETWITYGLMDPNTKYPLYNTLTGNKPTDGLPDWYTMTCIFIQLDSIGINVFRSWLVTNMFPKSTGDITGKKDKSSANEILDLDIDFTGIAQYGVGVNQLAQNLLKSINFVGANPNLRPAFLQNIEADVSAASYGFNKNITDLGSAAVFKP